MTHNNIYYDYYYYPKYSNVTSGLKTSFTILIYFLCLIYRNMCRVQTCNTQLFFFLIITTTTIIIIIIYIYIYIYITEASASSTIFHVTFFFNSFLCFIILEFIHLTPPSAFTSPLFFSFLFSFFFLILLNVSFLY